MPKLRYTMMLVQVVVYSLMARFRRVLIKIHISTLRVHHIIIIIRVDGGFLGCEEYFVLQHQQT